MKSKNLLLYRQRWAGLLAASGYLLILCGAASASPTSATFVNGKADPFGQGTYNGVTDVTLNGQYSAYKNYNYGVDEYITADPAQNTISLLRFDLSSMQGHFDTLESASLQLYYRAGVQDANYSLHVVSSSNAGWIQGTGNGAAETNGAATYNNKASFGGNNDVPWEGGPGLGWDTPNPGFDTDSVADGILKNDTNIVVLPTSLIASWINNPSENGGLVLLSDARTRFGSSENSWDLTWPQLTVYYTVPEPASLSLLSIGLVGLTMRRRRRR